MTAPLKNMMQAILMLFNGKMYNSALTKYIYLVDIESVRVSGHQATNIKWVRDNFGPFVWDVINCAYDNPELFEVHERGDKRLVSLKGCERLELSKEIEILIDKVKASAPDPNLSFLAFRDYVYNTPPMVVSRGHGPLDIEKAVKAAQRVDEIADSYLNTPEWDYAFKYLSTH